MSIHWEETTGPLKQENKALRAEIDRLRAALERIAEANITVIVGQLDVKGIASRALKDKP